MSQLVECVPNFSEGNNQEVRLLWGWQDVWVFWSQEGSEFGVGGDCLQDGQSHSLLAPSKEPSPSALERSMDLGGLWRTGKWAWGFWSAPGGGHESCDLSVSDSEVP